MNSSIDTSVDASALLTQLRSMAREAGMPAPVHSASDGGLDALARVGEGPDVRRADGVVFTDLFRRSVEGVNARSQTSRGLTEAFESGHADVELADVMIAVQKARVSFEALVQVRNKMIAAYKEVMSMPL